MKNLQVLLLAGLIAGCSGGDDRQAPAPDVDYAANAARWITDEFQPSTLSEEEQLAELAL